ncbi:MAG TPA: dihydrofolate reductase, partial [Lacunisphaera sp.]|nr:dihydrofolate reductase [Lacunisphaera sp.]
MAKPLNLIVACAENRVIGRAGRLPFDIPEDKAWFHAKTAGQTVLLGRICFETWPKVLADGRSPVVITRNQSLASERVRVAASVTAALAMAQTLPGEIMICGGQR